VSLVLYRGVVLSEMGRFAEAAGEIERSTALAHEIGDVDLEGSSHRWRAVLAYRASDAAVSIAQARRALELSEKTNPFFRMEALESLALASMLNGDAQRAVAALEEALSGMRERSIVLHLEAAVVGHLAEASLQAGDVEGARALATEAVTIARTRETKAQEIAAHLALVRAQLADQSAQDRARIDTSLRRAADLIQETGARAYAPFVHVERARLARLAGDKSACARDLRTAQRLFSEMGAARQVARVKEQLASESDRRIRS
jgi:ATP/maltotriose-dependent transcriptional regulator MalT